MEDGDGVFDGRFGGDALYALDDDAFGFLRSRHACIVHYLVDVGGGIGFSLVLQRFDESFACFFDAESGDFFEPGPLLVDEVGEACLHLFLLLLEQCLLCLHALPLGVGFLLAPRQFVLLLVELHLALLDAVLGLLYLLVVLPHFLLEFRAFAQELLLHFKQFLLLDDFCLFLGVLACLFGQGLSLGRHGHEVPYGHKDEEHYDGNREGYNDIYCHVLDLRLNYLLLTVCLLFEMLFAQGL